MKKLIVWGFVFFAFLGCGRQNHMGRFDENPVREMLTTEEGLEIKTTYWPNAKLKSREEHVGGLKNGKCVNWYENGDTLAEAYYVAGKRHGAFTLWEPNGKISFTWNYVNDVRFGKQKHYREDGTFYDDWVDDKGRSVTEKEFRKSYPKYYEIHYSQKSSGENLPNSKDATVHPRHKNYSYFEKRLHDFSDIFAFGLGIGYGISSHVSIFDTVGGGVGVYSKGYYVGNLPRHDEFTYVSEKGNHFPVSTVLAPVMVPLLYTMGGEYAATASDIFPRAFCFNTLEWYYLEDAKPRLEDWQAFAIKEFSVIGRLSDYRCFDSPSDLATVGRGRRFPGVRVGVFAGIVGLDAGLSPVELADFFVGWFGLDFMGDDGLPLEDDETGDTGNTGDTS